MLRNRSGYGLFLWFTVIIVTVFGWLENVIWTFNQSTIVNVALGILGCIAAPIGVIHGLWVAL